MYWRRFFKEERGQFTIEAIIICIFIIGITMTIISSVIDIFEGVFGNRELDKMRYMIEAFNYTL